MELGPRFGPRVEAPAELSFPNISVKSFLVTGMGRFGTAFLARMLGRVPNAAVRHEAIGNREFVFSRIGA